MKKRIVKTIYIEGVVKMRGRDKFARYKPAIIALTRIYNVFPRKMRARFMEKNRKKTGTIALVKRYALLKTLAKRVGDNVAIFPDVHFRNIQGLEVGDNVSFQPMVYVDAYGGVSVGSDVSFAEGSSVFSFNHGFDDLDTPIKDQSLKALPIKIENNVWIGAKATILGGVTIASGTIIAAGAVVNKDTEKNSTVAGVPAHVIKIRGDENG